MGGQNYYTEYSKKKFEEIGDVLCGKDKICILNETECPNYSNLTILYLMKGKEKLDNILISSVDINCNDITCSVLYNNIWNPEILRDLTFL